MAKAKKNQNKISDGQSVEIDGVLYGPGDEDKLAGVIHQGHVKTLTKAGAISGFTDAPDAPKESKKTGGTRNQSARPGNEPLSFPAGDVTDGNETARRLGGPGIESGPGKSKFRKASDIEDEQDDDDEADDTGDADDVSKKTVAELEDYLGDDVPTEGSGSNGRVLHADLVKAAQKKARAEAKSAE
jgi:hypothetical protein